MRIAPDLYFLLAVCFSVIAHVLIPIWQLIRYPISLLGLVIGVGGYLLITRANSILRAHNTSILPFESPSELVNTGPFRYSRNPIYLGMTLMLFGVAWFLGSAVAFVSPILFALIINIFVISDEEQQLEQKFKTEFTFYKEKVRRWL